LVSRTWRDGFVSVIGFVRPAVSDDRHDARYTENVLSDERLGASFQATVKRQQPSDVLF
jgi:hypothetical protein